MSFEVGADLEALNYNTARAGEIEHGASWRLYIESWGPRQQWWNELTSEQQAEYIEKRQARKAEERKNSPPKELKFNPKYPWFSEGINDTNRKQWLALIQKKNPWLKVGMLVWLLL